MVSLLSVFKYFHHIISFNSYNGHLGLSSFAAVEVWIYFIA